MQYVLGYVQYTENIAWFLPCKVNRDLFRYIIRKYWLLQTLQQSLNLRFLCPNFQEVEGSHCFWVVCSCVHPSIHPSVHSSYHILRTMHVRVLKFHIGLHHQKLVDRCFFFLVRFHSFWSYVPLEKTIVKSCQQQS